MRSLQLLLFLLLLPLLAVAQPVAPPLATTVQARLDALSARKLPAAEEEAANQALQKTLSELAAAEDSRRQLTSLRQQLERAPVGLLGLITTMPLVLGVTLARMSSRSGIQPLASSHR